jgi:uncharacterized protein
VSRDFQIFAKPAGAVCNLDCRYCYYLEKRHLYPGATPHRMPPDLLEHYILEHIRAATEPIIRFSWHGGEPTILGLEYYRNVVALQKKHQPPGRLIVNGIQTNGVLLDEDWCRFMAAEGFAVGLSLDGPRELHDRYRITRGKEPTHVQAVRAFELLQRYRIPCDLLCVVHDCNVRHPKEVYRFFREIGGKYVGFLPIVERVPGANGEVTPETVPAEAFGTFLCTVFDEWIRRDTQRLMVQIFDEASRPARGLEHSLCIFRETCGQIPAVEHNGDFYCCDHFVQPAFRLGNIRETSLSDLLDSPAQRAFGDAKRDTLPRYCRECEVLDLCHGACPKDRFIRTPEGEPGLNYLCAGLKQFFTHSRPQLLQLVQKSAAAATRSLQADRRPQTPVRSGSKTSRNDPCPCGSGRKYKKCCLQE